MKMKSCDDGDMLCYYRHRHSRRGRGRDAQERTTPLLLLLLHHLLVTKPVVVEGRNVAITSTGVAIATRSPDDGLTTFNAKRSKQEDHVVLMMGGRNFVDVAVDPTVTGNRKHFVFALSAATRRVCSLQLLNEGGYFFGPVGCAPTPIAVSPFAGLAVMNGTLVVSGGTGGLSVFTYNTETGVLDDPPFVLNKELDGVVGHPDVTMVTPSLVALSTDFATGDFGTVVASIDGSDIDSVRSFVVEDSIGFDFALPPANFPLVSAIYYEEGGGTYMYTANGPITVQDPTRDGDAIVVEGAPDGFLALTVAVNSDLARAVFGGIVADDDGAASSLVLFDVSEPLRPTFLASQSVDTGGGGRITSVATSGTHVVYVAEGMAEVGSVDINFPAPTPPPPTVPPPTPQFSAEPPVGGAPTPTMKPDNWADTAPTTEEAPGPSSDVPTMGVQPPTVGPDVETSGPTVAGGPTSGGSGGMLTGAACYVQAAMGCLMVAAGFM